MAVIKTVRDFLEYGSWIRITTICLILLILELPRPMRKSRINKTLDVRGKQRCQERMALPDAMQGVTSSGGDQFLVCDMPRLGQEREQFWPSFVGSRFEAIGTIANGFATTGF